MSQPDIFSKTSAVQQCNDHRLSTIAVNLPITFKNFNASSVTHSIPDIGTMAGVPFFWSEAQRDLGWIVSSIARKGLKLAITPCIASAFAILHRFFHEPIRPDPPDLCILLTSAIFLACKIEDQYRPVVMIFKELSSALQTVQCRVPRGQIIALFGDRAYGNCELSDPELKQIGLIEIEFLNALQWNMSIDLPFRHVHRIDSEFRAKVKPREPLDARLNNVVRDLCLIMKDAEYLDFPPELSAAVAVSRCFADMELPESVGGWIEQMKTQNPEQFKRVFERVAGLAALCVQSGQVR
jgi:hypothetical protein